MMITTKDILEIANSMAQDEGVSVPADFDPQLILDELGAEPWELTNDFEFLADFGHELIVMVSRQLGI